MGQRVKSPHIKTSKRSGKRQNHKEDNRPRIIRGDCQTRDGVNEPKDEVGKCKPANVDHRLPKSRLDNSIAHADNQEQEERERVTASVQNCDDNHQDLRTDVASIAVLVIIVKPCHQHLDNQEYDDGRNVVLDSDYNNKLVSINDKTDLQKLTNIVPMLNIEEPPETEITLVIFIVRHQAVLTLLARHIR